MKKETFETIFSMSLFVALAIFIIGNAIGLHSTMMTGKLTFLMFYSLISSIISLLVIIVFSMIYILKYKKRATNEETAE